MKGRFLFAVVLLILAALSVGGVWWSAADHDAVFSDDHLLTANASELKSTFVSADQDVPIRSGENVLWCGTFQLAWNETCSLVKEDLHFAEPSPLADALNKHSFTKADLDDASYVALAGFIRDGIHERIHRALKEKYHGLATPRFIPSASLTPRPQDIVAYSYLFKNLEFPRPFERLDSPLAFAGHELANFGFDEFKPGHMDLYSQVVVFDYQNEDDFVIELKTKSGDDRVILAKTPPADTLAATVAGVRNRADPSAGASASMGDILRVPKFNFDVTRAYEELQGMRLVPRDPAIAKDLTILSAIQNIRFQMDEKGVRLKSESHMSFSCGMPSKPRPQHIMIFDKPFLLLLQRADAESPYFALWVDNPELLVPW